MGQLAKEGGVDKRRYWSESSGNCLASSPCQGDNYEYAEVYYLIGVCRLRLSSINMEGTGCMVDGCSADLRCKCR